MQLATEPLIEVDRKGIINTPLIFVTSDLNKNDDVVTHPTFLNALHKTSVYKKKMQDFN